MALDTTLSGENSNSYVTLAEANEYLADNAAFMALNDTGKETLLKKATAQIDTLRFFGEKVEDTQALKFPRYVSDEYGNEVAQEEIPTKVKYATMEQAAHILSGQGAKRLQAQQDGVTSVRIGDVAETYSGMAGSQISLAATAKGYLKGLVSRIGRITNY